MADANGIQTNAEQYAYYNPGPGEVAVGSSAVSQSTEASHYDLNPAFKTAVDTQGQQAGLGVASPEGAEPYGAADTDNPIVGMEQREGEPAPTDHSAQIPGVPTGVTAVAGGTAGHVTVSWTAPVDLDGYALTGYTVTGTSGTGGATTPVTMNVSGDVVTADVAGLTSAATYMFTVHATNSAGSSAESAASPGVVVP